MDPYPTEAISEVARDVGASLGLPADWLNDAAKTYIPIHKEPDWQLMKTVGTLTICFADIRAMLAMKIRASRGQRDQGDLKILLVNAA